MTVLPDTSPRERPRIHVVVAPGLPEEILPVRRGPDETAEDHAARTEVLNRLFGLTGPAASNIRSP